MWHISLENVDMIFGNPQLIASGKCYRQQVGVDEDVVGP